MWLCAHKVFCKLVYLFHSFISSSSYFSCAAPLDFSSWFDIRFFAAHVPHIAMANSGNITGDGLLARAFFFSFHSIFVWNTTDYVINEFESWSNRKNKFRLRRTLLFHVPQLLWNREYKQNFGNICILRGKYYYTHYPHNRL